MNKEKPIRLSHHISESSLLRKKAMVNTYLKINQIPVFKTKVLNFLKKRDINDNSDLKAKISKLIGKINLIANKTSKIEEIEKTYRNLRRTYKSSQEEIEKLRKIIKFQNSNILEIDLALKNCRDTAKLSKLSRKLMSNLSSTFVRKSLNNLTLDYEQEIDLGVFNQLYNSNKTSNYKNVKVSKSPYNSTFSISHRKAKSMSYPISRAASSADVRNLDSELIILFERTKKLMGRRKSINSIYNIN